MEILESAIQEYLDSLLPARPEVFREMERLAEEESFPAVGPHVGSLLELLARSVRAQRIFELGSGFGYSALWLVQGMEPDGRIILTDRDAGNLQSAREYFRRAGLEEFAEFRQGDALNLLELEIGPFDLIFNDADKEDYPHVVDLAHSRLAPGGLLVSDNTLWGGRVVDPVPGDETAEAIRLYNHKLALHRGFLTVQIPIRDGVSVSIRK
ncbi:MAG: O-methyltransferase [Candidatus Zixiibacteriota bacterium]|nr:MAG: O-methyltransferase [candidate division Zixibacteria bacterium]